MVWRLNSDNWVFEDMVYLLLHNRINGKESFDGLEDLVNKGWPTGGRLGTPKDLKIRHPMLEFTYDKWVAAKMYRTKITMS